MTLLEQAKARCDLFDLYDEPVDITRVRVHVTSLPFRWRWKEMTGLALNGRRILVKPGHEHNLALLTHELVHVWQSQALGAARQFIQYEVESRRSGYWDNHFEVEARFVAGQE